MTQRVEQVNYIPLPKPQWVKTKQWWMYVVMDPRDHPLPHYPKSPVRTKEIIGEYIAVMDTSGIDGNPILRMSFADLLYTWRWVYLGDKEIPNQVMV